MISFRSSCGVTPVYGPCAPAVRNVLMIASVLARFVAMSASATINWASRPVAIGIGELTDAYLPCNQSGTLVPELSFPVLVALMRGSLAYDACRYRAPIDDDGIVLAPFSWKTRFWRRVFVFDDVAFHANA